jgi:hypothetical protein
MITLNELPYPLNEASFRNHEFAKTFDYINLIDNVTCDPVKLCRLYLRFSSKKFVFCVDGNKVKLANKVKPVM